MAGAFTAVDLSKLPFPGVLETLDFEAIFAQVLADLVSLDPAYSALVESDPALKVLQAVSYLSLHHRNRINEAAKAVMLAYAEKTDLDQIAANYNVARLLVTPGDPNTVPPTFDIYEDDESLRRRVQLSFEGFSVAGPIGAYIFHALGADGQVKDAAVHRPIPGTVAVAILSRTGTGVPGQPLLDIVAATLTDETVRPLNDTVTVSAATIVNYTVNATLTFYSGPDSTVVMQSAQAAMEAYTAAMHRLGRDITLSGVYAALHQEGVQNVALTTPAADIVIDWDEAGYCTSITLIDGGGVNE